MYIESSVISYLTARQSREIVTAAHQKITMEWWELRRPHYQSFVSEAVVDEISDGDPEAAQKRIAAIEGFKVLHVRTEAQQLAADILKHKALPPKAAVDALHAALAAVYEMDYLLTWNCVHLANAEIRRDLVRIVAARGYELPVICTPEELMGEDYVERSNS